MTRPVPAVDGSLIMTGVFLLAIGIANLVMGQTGVFAYLSTVVGGCLFTTGVARFVLTARSLLRKADDKRHGAPRL